VPIQWATVLMVTGLRRALPGDEGQDAGGGA